ncbi:MAG: ABC transporter permease [Chloroflexi bacterium]|nr:ABC transporter permease [Chloroflexota bacterium]
MSSSPHSPITAVSPAALERFRQRPTGMAAFWIGTVRFLKTKPLGAFGAALVLLMIFCAVFADIVAPQDPLALNPPYKLMAPNAYFLFGTDELGRDLLSRIIYGARSSMQAGFAVLIGGTMLGAVIGVSTGYFGGLYDLLMQRVMDAFFAFPLIVLAMGIVAMLGQSFWNVVIALSVVLIPGIARVLRGSTLSLIQNQYIEAARALGATDYRIITYHIFPNVMAPIIVLASINLGAVILVESSLSFLGLGTPPPTPTWGAMLSGSGRRFMEVAPWMAIFPGIAISVAVLGLNLLGDALRDVLDPRLRGR